MNIHQNARLTPSGRERLVRLAGSGLSPKAVAETMAVCPKTVGKWVARSDAEGVAGLQDRSSRPHRLHRPTPARTQDATDVGVDCFGFRPVTIDEIRRE